MADHHLISLQPGTVIAGRYEVMKCLGAGSMGLVYACRHKELTGHKVAIKVLFPEVASDKIAAARFRNEIFAAYGVSHPNVVRAYEYIRDGDLVAYTMEYVDGGDLAERLAGGEQMGVREIVRTLAQMAAGVQAIHDAGIVHRDLKPENILLTRDGIVKIADFGIARTGHGPKLTEHGGVVGTIDYVSPEYMLNSQVDWRSDIYALGILGYEMMTGESPFRGDSVYATMTKRLKTDPKPPSQFRPDCPHALDEIILRAMARDPEARYQAAAEMFFELQKLDPEAVGTTGLFIRPSRAPVAAPAPAAEFGTIAQSDIGTLGEDTNGVIQPEPAVLAGQPQVGGQYNARAAVPEYRAQLTDAERTIVAPNVLEVPTAFGIQATEVLSPSAAIDYASYGQEYEHDTVVEPERMERVLNPEMGMNASRPQMPVEVSIGSRAFDDQRLRRLAEMAQPGKGGRMVEILVALVAILIGVGVGLACVRLFSAPPPPTEREAPNTFGVVVGSNSSQDAPIVRR